jgi:hypothetical protein
MEDNIFGVQSDVPASDPSVTASPAPVSEPQDQQVVEVTPETPAADAPARPEPAAAHEEDEDREFLSEDEANGFRIGNKVYKDIAAADHVFRQFSGRARAEKERRERAESERDEARMSRAQLASAFEMLQSERAQQPRKDEQTGTPAEAAPAPAPKRLADLISDEEIDKLIAKDGPGAAFRHLAKLVDDDRERVLEEATRDTRPFLRQRETVDRTVQTFDGAAALVDESGNPFFPEVVDPNTPAAKAVYAIWQRNFADPALAPLAFTQHGIQIAVNEFRAENGQPASRGPRTAAGAAVAARRTADASLQGMGTDSRASARIGGPGPVEGNEERYQRLNRSRQHEVFGVADERS